MKIYQEEWDAAVRFQQIQNVPRFSKEQLRAIRNRSRRYAFWTKNHPRLHNTINCVVLLSLFFVDLVGLLGIPAILWSNSPSPARFALIVGLTSIVHGFIAYSVIVFSMHEGAAHRRIIVDTGPISRGLAALANNACRVFFADPVFYRSRHLLHHQDFGTVNDGAFTNFVHSRRFWVSLLPLAGLLDFNDYKIHSDTKWSVSRWLSLVIGVTYLLAVGLLMATAFGLCLPLLVLFVFGPWFTFLLDRLRETTEHNLLALDGPHGRRNLGCGFWGLLIGGGPWGQPCHLSHHISPSLPWYHQCLLHRQMARWMTPEQRRYFTIRAGVGYPLLLYRVLRENLRYIPLGQTKTAVEQSASPTTPSAAAQDVGDVGSTKTTDSRNSSFLPPSTGARPCRVRLFCFPHLGGGTAGYRRWSQELSNGIELVPVMLPGRESRMNEPALDKMSELIDELAKAVAPWDEIPSAFYGHSMGAVVAYELARRLMIEGEPGPICLFVSSCPAPDRVKNDDPRHTKSDDEMITALVDAFGIEDAVQPDELSLMRMMAPTIRADVKLLETYEFDPVPRLSCPIVAIRGTKDKLVSFSDILAWKALTNGSCSVRAYSGGHFFLRDHQRGLVQLINGQLDRRLRSISVEQGQAEDHFRALTGDGQFTADPLPPGTTRASGY